MAIILFFTVSPVSFNIRPLCFPGDLFREHRHRTALGKCDEALYPFLCFAALPRMPLYPHPLAIFGLYPSNLLPFYQLQPPLLRKRQQSCSSMKRASHAKSECTSCAGTSKAGCVLAPSSASPEPLKMLSCEALPPVWI